VSTGLEGAKHRQGPYKKKNIEKRALLTLDFCNRVNQYISLNSVILERRDDLVDDGLGKIGLFALFHLLFVADPAVQDGLEFCSDGDLLLLDVVL
jgi:hypothetical protein